MSRTDEAKKHKGPHKAGFGAIRAVTPVMAPTIHFEKAGAGGPAVVDLRRWCSPIAEQRPMQSCNACSVVGALEYLMLMTGQTLVPLSILYVYYNGRKIAGMQNEDGGMIPAHATAGVMAYGVCEDRLWPNQREHVNDEPPKNCYDQAKALGVQYARLDANNDAAKASIVNKIPVIIGWGMPKGYYDAVGSNGKMPDSGFDDQPHEGHSMLCVGYDDNARHWIVRNSWGANWGDRGYCYIPYALADRYAWANDMWVIGALAKSNVARLAGASVDDSVADTKAKGPDQAKAALDQLREDLRKELQSDLDDAKATARSRLRADADEVTKRRDEFERTRRAPGDAGGGRGGGDDNKGGGR